MVAGKDSFMLPSIAGDALLESFPTFDNAAIARLATSVYSG
jgi:hypothetical protein